MTEDDFRNIALGQAGAVEQSHMNHPDFRLNGRIFATLAYPDHEWGMVKLPPEDQAVFVQREPSVFRPVAGAWGRGGATQVRLAEANEDSVGEAMRIAAETVRRMKPVRKR